jgi:hypothetical protein
VRKITPGEGTGSRQLEVGGQGGSLEGGHRRAVESKALVARVMGVGRGCQALDP